MFTNIGENFSADNDICGQAAEQSYIAPFIYNGDATRRGEWPWSVAMFHFGTKFVCGGTLVSNRMVISAAHCINTGTRRYEAHEVLLWLGRYSLKVFNEDGAIATGVDRIHVHPEYKTIDRDSFDADIALLITTKIIEYTSYVRPVCLWSESTDISLVEGKEGTVVGWGKIDVENTSDILRKIDLPIVNALACVRKTAQLNTVVSNRTFCAGTLDGSGPCMGDSGKGIRNLSG